MPFAVLLVSRPPLYCDLIHYNTISGDLGRRGEIWFCEGLQNDCVQHMGKTKRGKYTWNVSRLSEKLGAETGALVTTERRQKKRKIVLAHQSHSPEVSSPVRTREIFRQVLILKAVVGNQRTVGV